AFARSSGTRSARRLLHPRQRVPDRAAFSSAAATIASADPSATSGVVVSSAQQLLEVTHSTIGLPWWATMLCVTAGVHLVAAFPFRRAAIRSAISAQNIAPELNTLALAGNKLREQGYIKEALRMHRRISSYLVEKGVRTRLRDVAPILALLPAASLLDAPFMLAVSRLAAGGHIQPLADLPVTAELGLLPLNAFTVASITTAVYVTVRHVRMRVPVQTSWSRGIVAGTMIASGALVASSQLVTVPLLVYISSATACYTVQMMLFNLPQTRQMFGIPPPRPQKMVDQNEINRVMEQADE
ncbi:hypothetical protein GQ42DRAFT_173795, partial [Ramicandelaber brevisporus]